MTCTYEMQLSQHIEGAQNVFIIFAGHFRIRRCKIFNEGLNMCLIMLCNNGYGSAFRYPRFRSAIILQIPSRHFGNNSPFLRLECSCLILAINKAQYKSDILKKADLRDSSSAL